jgi:signal transduction histidine kinase/sugar lactone lactonase YvrE
VDSLALDKDGALWVGTRGGLARLYDGKFSHLGTEDGLADSVVRALWIDHEGSLWIGTQLGGLERLWDGRFTVFSQPEGLADGQVFSILEDRRGALWFGTRNGLTRLDHGRPTTWTERDGLVVPIVTSLYEDRRGTIWVGTTDALHRFESGKLVPFKPGGELFHAYISAFWEDPQGTLWIATDAGLLRLSDAGFKLFTTADGLSCTNLVALEPDLDGGLWIASGGGGLIHMKDGRFTVIGPAQGLSEVDLYALQQDPDGTLWIGTNGGGLDVLRAGKIHVLTTRQGLFDDVILQILDDGLGHLWLPSSRGLARVDKAQLLEVAAGRRSAVSAAVFDTADGLRSAELVGGGQEPSAIRARDGRLWFSTLNGAAVLDPRRLGAGLAPPSVQIEQLLVDGEPRDVAASVRIAPGSHRIEIAYTAPTFTAPGRVRFRARLEGFDGDWIEMGNRRTAVYTNLPPGDYRFHVRAASPDGVWGREGAPLAFELQPRFYQTPWFAGLAVLAVALASWSAYRLQMRQVRLRYEGILAERERIAGDLHDSLAQTLTGLALQIESTDQALADTAVARHHVRRARDLVRESLEASRRSVWNLRARNDGSGLAGALSRLGEPFDDADGSRVAVAVAGPERPLPAMVESHLLRIGQEAVANAIRHGQAQHVRIQLRFENGRVLLLVDDDGAGFSPGELPHPRDGHFGLTGMRERTRQLHGSLSVDSRPGAGTHIRVEVPLEGAA